MKVQKLSFYIALAGLLIVSAAGFSACQKKQTASPVEAEKKSVYQCPMHPHILSDQPGSCPICGMPLVLRDQDSPTNQGTIPSHASVFVSPEHQQFIGVTFEEVKERPLAVKIRTLGRVGYDPDLYESIAEYQAAATAYRRYRGNPSTIVKERVDVLHDLAMLKLRLTGFSDRQIEGLTNTGQLLTHFELKPDTGWIYADIYEYESNLVKAGDHVTVTSVSFPGEIFHGEVRSVDTLLNASSRIMRARIELEPHEKKLLAGASVDVVIEASVGTNLAIPEDAVVDTGDSQIVFVDQGEGHLEPKQVRLGYEADHYYEVLSGLSEGEKVVRSATFLIDSESRLRAAAQAMPAAVSSENKPSVSSAGHQHG